MASSWFSLYSSVNDILTVFCTYFVCVDQIQYKRYLQKFAEWLRILWKLAHLQPWLSWWHEWMFMCTVCICCVVWVNFHVHDLHIILLMDCELYFLIGINESKCTCIPCTLWHCKTKKCLHKVCVLVAEYTIYCVLYDTVKLKNGFIKSLYWNLCFSWTVWLLKMALIGRPRLLVNNYQSPPCNSPEEPKFYLHRSGSPKSHLGTGHRVYCAQSCLIFKFT